MTEFHLHRLRGLLIDLDGVVYLGDTLIPGAREFFATLCERGMPYLLVTNNSSRTRAQFAGKLSRLGIPVSEEQVLTSAEVTAEYLSRRARAGAGVFIVGEEGLAEAVGRYGFRTDVEPVEYVLVGLDRAFDYRKLALAIRYVRAGAALVGANPDRTLPVEGGVLPGAGSLLAAVEAGAGVRAEVVGKPEPVIFELGARRLGLPAGDVAVVGDRLDTDILGARRAGMRAILVLTGISRRADLADSPVQPDLVVDDLPALARALFPGLPRDAAD